MLLRLHRPTWQALGERLLLAFAAIAVAIQCVRSFSWKVGFDEGYNLQVARSLVAGKGYASYGNNLSRSVASGVHVAGLAVPFAEARLRGDRWPFDPLVSTGPAVLLPVAGVYWLSGGSLFLVRCLMVALALAYLLMLWLHFPTATRRGALLAGLLAFLTLWHEFQPTAVLGELPGTVFALLGLLVWQRHRPWLAGLGFGLAVQAKTMFALPLAVTGLCSIYMLPKGGARRVGWLVRFATTCALPTLLFEGWRWASLGDGAEWCRSWREYLAFARAQVVPFWTAAGLWPKKMSSFVQEGPNQWMLLALCFAAVAAELGRPRRASTACTFLPSAEAEKRGIACEVLAGVAGLAYFASWLLLTGQTWWRQGVPGILLAFPALGAWLWRRGPWTTLTASLPPLRRACLSCAALCAAGSYAVAVGVQAEMFWRQDRQREKVQSLAAAAALVRSQTHGFSWAWAPFIEDLSWLTGLRRVPCATARTALVLTGLETAALGVDAEQWRQEHCADVVFEEKGRFVICWPQADLAETRPLSIKNWEPQEVTLHSPAGWRLAQPRFFRFSLAKAVVPRPVLLVAEGKAQGVSVWEGNATFLCLRRRVGPRSRGGCMCPL